MTTQFTLNTLVAGSHYAIVATGFALAYRSMRIFDFGYAAVYAVAPYSALLVYRVRGVPLPVAFGVGVAAASVFAAGLEFCDYRPLRHRGASSLVLMMASFGVLIVAQNVISMAFGNEANTLRTWEAREGYEISGAYITGVQVLTVFCAAGLLLATYGLLRLTRIGKRLRAVTSNVDLAYSIGFDVDSVVVKGYMIAAALGAVAAILVGLDTDLTPGMGLPALLPAVVVCIIGGVDSLPGVIAGAFLLAGVQQLAIWGLGSQWQDTIAFVVLLLFLVARPRGFWGRRAKKATV